MKRLIVSAIFTLLSLQLVFADGYDTFHQALTMYGQSKYKQAREYFEDCLNNPDFEEVKVNINNWIAKCNNRIQEQEQNAQAAEKKRQAKIAQRKENQLVYISVNGAESGDIYSSTESAMSDVMRLNGRKFCPNLDDALTVVTVTLNIKTLEPNNGFYKATGNGVVRLGNAIDEKEFVGQWSVDCEATSAINADDAKRLLRNKLNYKLSYALENLLNGRPQSSDYYIPKQSISLYFSNNNIVSENDLSILKESLNGYISRTPGMTLSSALDQEKNDDRDALLKITSQYVKMESRAPIHELEGFEQILRISVKQDRKYLDIIGEISELSTGTILSTVTVKGEDFDIDSLNSKNQEIVAKMLAVGLGFKNWEIGEYLGDYRLASYKGLHIKLIQEYYYIKDGGWARATTRFPQEGIDGVRTDMIHFKGLDPVEARKWRLPTEDELLEMCQYRIELKLDGIYWSRTSKEKKYHQVVNVFEGESFELKDRNTQTAYILLIKEI